ncbi:MAG: hypothetical protein JF614_27285 [Acidobacteria bacterium]|nr:hypothetical protein [Acidobacteriota bacterium]
MRSFLSRRSAAALLLTLLLAALSPGLALARSRPRAAEPRQPAPASVLSRLGDWLLAFVEKNGAEVDPNGAPKNVSPAPPPGPPATTDNGAELDPNGRL